MSPNMPRNIAAFSAPRALAAMKAQIWTAMDDDYTTAFAAADKEQDIAIGHRRFPRGVCQLSREAGAEVQRALTESHIINLSVAGRAPRQDRRKG